MLRADGNDVPVFVGRGILLHMCANFWLHHAAFLRTVARERGTTELFPMVEPTATPTLVAAGAIYIFHIHDTSQFSGAENTGSVHPKINPDMGLHYFGSSSRGARSISCYAESYPTTR